VQRATSWSKTGIFRDYSVAEAEASPGFQADWSEYVYLFLLSLFIHII
jgi:hypothetical protein